MALLTDEQKNNFDTTLPANYDAGDGTLNPQPLNVDEEGALVVTNQGGIVSANMLAYDDNSGAHNVRCDHNGALDVGGIKLGTLQSGNSYVVFSAFNTMEDLVNNSPSVMNSFVAFILSQGWNRMYGYESKIVYDGSKFNFVLSAFGADLAE
jgi:hypothetical protein